MRLWHRHRWVLISTRQGRRTTTDLRSGQRHDIGDITAALYRCGECGKPTTRELDGLWTAEELRGKP